jgi:hypothetical protein
MRLPRMPNPRGPYTPRLRADQVKALYHLKQRERRPMTHLVQEAVDRYLAPLGGVEVVIRQGEQAQAS